MKTNRIQTKSSSQTDFRLGRVIYLSASLDHLEHYRSQNYLMRPLSKVETGNGVLF